VDLKLRLHVLSCRRRNTGGYAIESPGNRQTEDLDLQVHNGQGVLHLRGHLNRQRVTELWRRLLDRLKELELKEMVVDFQEVADMDSAGIAFLRDLENRCAQRQVAVSHRNLQDRFEQLLAYVEECSGSSESPRPAAAQPGPVERLGEWSLSFFGGVFSFVRFIGDFAAESAWHLLHPHRLRVADILYQLQQTGAQAVPLVGSLSALMGMIMVFQGVSTVRQFGSDIFIVDVNVFAVTRQMGPLLTGIIIAGRSGAAMAAEIGTMRVNEEVDALEAMGLNVTRFLVLPRVIALMMAGPMLTMLSDLLGLMGGMVTSYVVLNLTPLMFVEQVKEVLTFGDIYTGAIRAFGFSTMIGLVGCFRWLRARMDAADIGVQVTKAVVAGIFGIVLIDAFLSAVFQMYGL
jgi:phospholipid/cholesterol/gamma-HCH transport system permease protein